MNTLATSPNPIPTSIGSDRFPIAAIQVDNYSGKFIQVDNTQFVPPFTQGWVTTLAPTPKMSIPLAVSVPTLAAQTGTDGTVVVTLYEDAIGASNGVTVATQQFPNIPEIVSAYFPVTTSVGGTVQSGSLAHLGVTGANFYIMALDFSYLPAGGAVLTDAIGIEVDFGTARSNGVTAIWVSPESPSMSINMHELFVNNSVVDFTGFSEAGAPAGRLTITYKST